MKRVFRSIMAHIMYFFTGRVFIGIKYSDINKMPIRYATKEAACADIYCDTNVSISPGEVITLDLGFACDIPMGFELHVYLRSSLGKQGLIIPNSVGIIDSDYRGNIHLIISNITNDIKRINKGDRVAQISVHRSTKMITYTAVELSETLRGTGGLGSTGK